MSSCYELEARIFTTDGIVRDTKSVVVQTPVVPQSVLDQAQTAIDQAQIALDASNDILRNYDTIVRDLGEVTLNPDGTISHYSEGSILDDLWEAERTLNPLTARARINSANAMLSELGDISVELDSNAAVLITALGVLQGSVAGLTVLASTATAASGLVLTSGAAPGLAYLLASTSTVTGIIPASALGSPVLLLSGSGIAAVVGIASGFLVGLSAGLIISTYRTAARDSRRSLLPEVVNIRAARAAFNDSLAGPTNLRGILREVIRIRNALQTDPTPTQGACPIRLSA